MIAPLYAAVLTLLYAALSAYVIISRTQLKIALGDGDHNKMRQRIRAHGNFIEYTPLFLILLFIAEYQGLSYYLVHAFGTTFLFGRLVHCYSLLQAEQYKNKRLLTTIRYRVIGMALTLTALSLLAAVLLSQYFYLT